MNDPIRALPSAPFQQSTFIPALILGGSLAVGMLGGSMILGHNAQIVAAAHESITVKGTAEKAIKADFAIWSTTVSVRATTIADGVPLLKSTTNQVLEALTANGKFKRGDFKVSDWSNFANFQPTKEGVAGAFIDYTMTQTISAKFDDVNKPVELNDQINKLIIQGITVSKASAAYQVNNIDQIKLSMIGEATKNAHDRATEFAKSGGVEVGAMQSASQGVFEIKSADEVGGEDDGGGGGNDTSSINKTARVVVTVAYGIR